MNKRNTDNKFIVGFDMDGVILDNAKLKIKAAKRMGIKVELGHTPSEVLKKMMPLAVWEEFQNTLYDHPEFAFSTPLMRGIKNVLAELTDREVPIYLISRRKVPEIAIEILKKHALWPKYFNESNSSFVKDPKDKNVEAKKLGITHYIDDELRVINALSSVSNKFLFDQFSVFKKADHYIKIKSWSEFKKHINI